MLNEIVAFYDVGNRGCVKQVQDRTQYRTLRDASLQVSSGGIGFIYFDKLSAGWQI